jgi:SSS family solute:Na+ symporter
MERMNTFNNIDYIIVGIYMLSMLLIGFLVNRLNKGDEDYFKGGNKIPWAMSAMSLFIGSFSAYMFVGASGQAFNTGPACLLLFTSPFWGCILVYYFFAHKWRRTRITSPMEFIQMRYGNGLRYFLSFLGIPLTFLGIGKLLFVLSIFLSSALGLTGEYRILSFSLNGLELCIIATGIIIVLYTTAGGLWAVILTDSVQFIIVMVMSVFVVPLSFIALGKGGFLKGIAQFATHPPTPDYFHLIKPSQILSFTLAWICLFLFSFPGNSAVAQRLYSVPNERDAKKTIALSAIFYVLAPMIWVFPIFVMRPLLTNMKELWPQLNNPNEATYVTITLMLLPNGMIGLMVSAILAATMSTVSTMYNIFSSIFIRDIYKPLFSRKSDPKELLHVGRIVTFICGIITIWVGIVLANYGKADAFTVTYTLVSHLSLVFALPVVAGILFRRIPWWTPFVSIPICLSTTLSLELFWGGKLAGLYPESIFGDIKKYLYQCKVFGAIIVNAAVFLIASLYYNENDPRNRGADELFRLMKKPVQEDENAALYVPNLKTYRVLGWVLAFFGACMIVLYLSGLTEDPRAINLIAGLIFMGLFGMIEWFTSPGYSPFEIVRRQLKESGNTETTNREAE